MTARERWEAVLSGEKPDKIPVDWWGTPEVEAGMKTHLGCDDIWDVFRKLHVDKLISVEPDYVGPVLESDTDLFGCRYINVAYEHGTYKECVFHPLARYESVEQIESDYRWPDPDWFDFSRMLAKLKGREDYPVKGPNSEPFYLYKYLRGEEQAFVDLILNPELTEYILEKLFIYESTMILRSLEVLPGRITCNMVAEDLGAQDSLMYSLEHIRKFFFPRMKKMMDLLHEDNVAVVTHSDGAVRDAIPGLIECGMDVLNPIQWRCAGMERGQLKSDFGEQIVFYGGVDNQITLPFGTADDVRREVAENIEILGKGGGYIIAPCHNLQPNTPLENIVAMYAAAWDEGFS